MQTGLKSGYSPHKKWDSYWPKLAEFMLRHQFNAEQCIWYVFQQRATGSPPQPNQIALNRYIEAFKKLNSIARDEIATEFKTDKQRFEVCVSVHGGQFDTPQEAWYYVLALDNESFSPLFRYCLAYSEKMWDLANYYELPATKQYITAPKVYDEVFGKWIPSEMKEQSNGIR